MYIGCLKVSLVATEPLLATAPGKQAATASKPNKEALLRDRQSRTAKQLLLQAAIPGRAQALRTRGRQGPHTQGGEWGLRIGQGVPGPRTRGALGHHAHREWSA